MYPLDPAVSETNPALGGTGGSSLVTVGLLGQRLRKRGYSPGLDVAPDCMSVST